jgi:PAS domain S-box-containing protein
MTDRDNKDLIIRFTSFGFLMGLIFPVVSFVIFSITGTVSFTIQGFIRLHPLFPVQLIMDLLPFIGGISGYFAGREIARLKSDINKIREQDVHKTKKMQEYIHHLIHNRFDEEFFFPDKDSDFTRALNDLREHLKNRMEEENLRKLEDSRRNWMTTGMARFSEMLRINTDDIEEYTFTIISNLVKYLDANQGGFFLVEEKNGTGKYFDLKACYAYNRKKFADKQIEWGEGLIGACALERQTVYLTDIPDSYLTITSGLGQTNPKYLLILPLISQEEVMGVIELASFRELKEYEIHFMEDVADSIATSLSGVKNNIRTARLLKESQEQAEILAQQEEKMRQSMEELRYIQEQAAKQAEKFISFTNSVNHTLIRAEYDVNGHLLYANTKFLSKLGYSGNNEVEGKHISIFINDKDREWFDKIWERLSSGGKHYEGYMKHVTRQAQDLWTMATYTCIRRDDGSVDRILFLAIDTTEQKKQSLDYEGQIEAINRLNMKAEFAPDGKFINCNNLFLDTFKYSRKELEGMTVFDFIDKKDLENFTEIWENVARGIPFQGQVKGFTKYEDDKWFRASYTSVNDMYGEVAKIVYIATDITNEKFMEMESQKQTDQLRIHEEKIKLATFELKKKLEQSRLELKMEYEFIEKERNRLNKILDNLNEIVLTINQEGHIHYINRAGEQFWNVNRNEILGQPGNKLFRRKVKKPDDFILNFVTPGKIKLTGEKIPVKLKNRDNKSVRAEMIISKMEDQGEIYYTASVSLI